MMQSKEGRERARVARATPSPFCSIQGGTQKRWCRVLLPSFAKDNVYEEGDDGEKKKNRKIYTRDRDEERREEEGATMRVFFSAFHSPNVLRFWMDIRQTKEIPRMI